MDLIHFQKKFIFDLRIYIERKNAHTIGYSRLCKKNSRCFWDIYIVLDTAILPLLGRWSHLRYIEAKTGTLITHASSIKQCWVTPLWINSVTLQKAINVLRWEWNSWLNMDCNPGRLRYRTLCGGRCGDCTIGCSTWWVTYTIGDQGTRVTSLITRLARCGCRMTRDRFQWGNARYSLSIAHIQGGNSNHPADEQGDKFENHNLGCKTWLTCTDDGLKYRQKLSNEYLV